MWMAHGGQGEALTTRLEGGGLPGGGWVPVIRTVASWRGRGSDPPPRAELP
jgi:hypothetical protein